MKYCKKCILPETYPGITFNSEGVCNFCQEHKSEDLQRAGKERLLNVLRSVTNESPYDCIVPVSGGKDSSYILYYIVKELGLKPLAVSYNSGFQHEIAEDNVRNACKKLGIQLEEIRSPGTIQKNLLKASYNLSKRTGMIWGCANCPAILKMVPINIARKYKVPFVIWGSSILETVDDNKYKKNRSKAVKRILNDPLIIYYGIQYVFYRTVQRIALKFPIRYVLNPFRTPPFTDENPKFIHFYDYVHWDSMRNVQLLEQEIGWKHPVGKDSRFDCTLHCVINLFYKKDYGISHDGLSFCNFVREGKMSRDEALAREHEAENSARKEYTALIERLS